MGTYSSQAVFRKGLSKANQTIFDAITVVLSTSFNFGDHFGACTIYDFSQEVLTCRQASGYVHGLHQNYPFYFGKACNRARCDKPIATEIIGQECEHWKKTCRQGQLDAFVYATGQLCERAGPIRAFAPHSYQARDWKPSPAA